MGSRGKGNFAANAGAITVFLNSPDKFPALITADDGTQWYVTNADVLRKFKPELNEYSEDKRQLLKVECAQELKAKRGRRR